MFVHSFLQPSFGQVGALVEATGAVQRVNQAAVQSVMMILQQRKAVMQGSGYKSKPGYYSPGNDPKADFWLYEATLDPPSPAPEGSYSDSAADVIALSTGFTSLVDIAALQKQLSGSGGNVPIPFVLTKDQAVVQQLAQPSAGYAVLQGTAMETATKKPEGIATPLIGGLIVGAVATVAAGPVAGVAAGLGTAALLHYAA